MMQSTQLLQNENESCGSSSLSVVSNDAIWRNWQTQSLETITVSIFSCCIYSTLAQLVRASDSYPEGRLFNSDMCYQRRREAVDNGYFDSQAVKTKICNIFYVGSIPTRLLTGVNATVSLFSRRLMEH